LLLTMHGSLRSAAQASLPARTGTS
jgi:hypothetical protein